jgi:hypothetical protein
MPSEVHYEVLLRWLRIGLFFVVLSACGGGGPTGGSAQDPFWCPATPLVTCCGAAPTDHLLVRVTLLADKCSPSPTCYYVSSANCNSGQQLRLCSGLPLVSGWLQIGDTYDDDIRCYRPAGTLGKGGYTVIKLPVSTPIATCCSVDAPPDHLLLRRMFVTPACSTGTTCEYGATQNYKPGEQLRLCSGLPLIRGWQQIGDAYDDDVRCYRAPGTLGKSAYTAQKLPARE